MNNDDDNIGIYPQRVTITLNLHNGTGGNTIAVHALLNMLERLQDSLIYPSAATLQFAASLQPEQQHRQPHDRR
jgi:hypothetical protein